MNIDQYCFIGQKLLYHRYSKVCFSFFQIGQSNIYFVFQMQGNFVSLSQFIKKKKKNCKQITDLTAL